MGVGFSLAAGLRDDFTMAVFLAGAVAVVDDSLAKGM